jgi:hypothetical protein
MSKERAMSRRKKARISKEVQRSHDTKMANRAANLGLSPDQPVVENKSKLETVLERRAERLAIPVDKLREHDRKSLRERAHLYAHCLDESVLNNPAITGEMAHILSCPMCAARVLNHHEYHQQLKNPLKLDFKPSTEWVWKLAEAHGRAHDILPESPEQSCELCGEKLARHIEARAYTARSAQLDSFVIVENGEFDKLTRSILDSAIGIPTSKQGEEVHRSLAQEFSARLKERGNDIMIGHRVLDRIVIEGDKVIGYVVLEPSISWPISRR